MNRIILSLFLLCTTVGTLLTSGLLPVNAALASGLGEASGGVGGSIEPVGESACRFITGTEHGLCTGCFSSGGAWTAVGCLGGESPTEFIASFIKIATGIGGGIAFLLILLSGFQTMLSAGNPEKLHAAKELMTAAISGLLLIVFSIFLLKIIGIDILAIPGFGDGGGLEGGRGGGGFVR